MHPEHDYEDQEMSEESDPLSGVCTISIERDLSCQDFVGKYMGIEPVVIRPAGGSVLANENFVKLSARSNMETQYGHLHVDMSTANSYTGRDWTTMSVKQYINTQLNEMEPTKMGNETYYLFGSTRGADWEAFLGHYRPPTLQYPSELFKDTSCNFDALASNTAKSTALSFGIAGRGSGVPFHFHGPGFLQQIHGKKRWFLYPPRTTPEFHPDESTLNWVRNILPTIDYPPTHDCVLEPGDIIYFPNNWMHATLNLSPYTVFMATFA